MERLESLFDAARNVTHTTGKWIVVENARIGLALPFPLDVSPEAVALVVAGGLVAVALVTIAVARVMTLAVARRKVRHNIIMVQIADNEPEDDNDEHELEKHSTFRSAAPGDSDYEDDPLASPRRGSK